MRYAILLMGTWGTVVAAGCGGTETKCGPGTVLQGNECIVVPSCGPGTALDGDKCVVVPSCGPGTELVNGACVVSQDPLVGVWMASRSDNPSNQSQCTFAPDHTWACTLLQNGWPSTWSRIQPNNYFLNYSNNEGCNGSTTFSDDNSTVSMLISGDSIFSGMTLSMSRVQ